MATIALAALIVETHAADAVHHIGEPIFVAVRTPSCRGPSGGGVAFGSTTIVQLAVTCARGWIAEWGERPVVRPVALWVDVLPDLPIAGCDTDRPVSLAE
jgi:hypothetical protein